MPGHDARAQAKRQSLEPVIAALFLARTGFGVWLTSVMVPRERKLHHETRAAVRGIGILNAAAVQHRDAANDGAPEACAAIGCVIGAVLPVPAKETLEKIGL